MNISCAIKKAKQYCDKKIYNHSLRVIEHIAEMDIIPNNAMKDDCICLILMYNLIGNTELTEFDAFSEYEEPCLIEALSLMEKPKSISLYNNYYSRIKKNMNTYSGKLAYFVTLADIKEHLCQKETLTDELKNRYLEGLIKLL